MMVASGVTGQSLAAVGIELAADCFPCLKIRGALVPAGLTLVAAPAALNHYASRRDFGWRWVVWPMKRRTSSATAATPLSTRERVAAKARMGHRSLAGAVLEAAVEQPESSTAGGPHAGGPVGTAGP